MPSTNDQKRVLFWEELYWPHMGGIEVLAAKMLPALKSRGYEFIVVTRQDDPQLPRQDEHLGITIYRFPFWKAAHDVTELVKVRRQVAELKAHFAPQLVHINGFGPCVYFHHETVAAHPSAVLLTLHNVLFTEPGESEQDSDPDQLLVRTLREASWVNGCAPTVLEQARQVVPQIAPRSSVINNGLDAPSVTPTPLPIENPRLLCLGRLHRQKGFDVALAAFARIVACLPQVRLVIAGEGPQREDLERQARELKIDAAVEFAGQVSPARVPALLNTATLVLMPSRWEGLPLVSLEAALMGRPIVATRVAGLTDVIVDEETGRLVDLGDEQALAEAVIDLLAEPQAAARMGQAARRRALDQFNWQRCVDGYDALYQQLIHAEETNDAIARSTPRDTNNDH